MSNFYELIKNDKTIIDIYDKIHKYEDEEKGRAYHDYNYVTNVAELVKELLEALEYDKEYYFTTKVFRAIRSFSEKMNLMPEVFINNEK